MNCRHPYGELICRPLVPAIQVREVKLRDRVAVILGIIPIDPYAVAVNTH